MSKINDDDDDGDQYDNISTKHGRSIAVASFIGENS